MKCSQCNHTLDEPTIQGQTAYWVCDYCGHCEETPASQPTPRERVETFENDFGLKLPEAYVELVTRTGAGSSLSIEIQGIPQTGQAIDSYFDNGTIHLSRINGVIGDETGSIFSSRVMQQEWELPDRLVLLDGDGHTWIALDYRQTQHDPPVIFIESDSGSSVQVAENFLDLMRHA